MIKNIKPTQLTRVGYSYQDLFCIRLLVDWFHNPSLYQWIAIEDAQTAQHKFKGLDDVVAFNHDGKYELYQVKFTIDSERDDLRISFDWLLARKGKGTSFLQKWAFDVIKYNERSQLARAVLKTNRVPDEAFSNVLNEGFIDPIKIPSKYLTLIYEQLGGRAKADVFFSHFEFHHSQEEINDLEEKLHDSLVPDHTTEEGWLRFLREVEIWATRKNLPVPDGKIRLSHLNKIFTAAISQSLSQFFEVPKGYTPPSKDFHENILTKTRNIGSWVISGRPGMGKSTYLSYLTDVLMGKGIPVIRHHYSLSSQSDIDRISFSNAARSIQLQLRNIFPNLFESKEPNPSDLEQFINTAVKESTRLQKKIVLIIDGLDHVGRERSNISQLEHLINRLLPFKDRICIFFGTQPVSSANLPSRMIADLPRKTHWLDLPPMDISAIRNWLEILTDEGEITLIGDENYKKSELSEIAEAFNAISNGYPLFLIYSLRELSYRTKHISKYDVEKLPPCPKGDIHQYYNLLWSNLSDEAKEVLFQISCVEFSWPDRESLSSCFQDSLHFTKAFNEIQHLFETRPSGIIPFHSSITVYLKSREEFIGLSVTLMQRAKQWLDTDAPEYWKWGWQWVIASYLGDPNPLLNGITREWLIESLCKGYPQHQIERIFSIAEKAAFNLEKYTDLIRLRLIKIRLINGPEFQVQYYNEFLQIALRNSKEPYSLQWRTDNLHILTDQEVAVVASVSRDDSLVVYRCFTEIIKRINFYVTSGSDNQHQRIDELIGMAFDCLSLTEAPDIERICLLLDQLNEKEEFFSHVIKKLTSSGNVDAIVDFPKDLIPEDSTLYYWDNFVLACCDSGISFLDRPEKENAIQSVYGAVFANFCNLKINTNHFLEPPSIISYRDVSYKTYQNIFFYSLMNSLSEFKEIEQPDSYIKSDVTTFSVSVGSFFKYAASRIAEKLLALEKIDIFYIYDLIEELSFTKRVNCRSDELSVWHAVSKALTHISITLYRLLRDSHAIPSINEVRFNSLALNDWWIAQNWLESAAEHGISHIVPKEIVVKEVCSAFRKLAIQKDSTATLANESLELTKLTSIYELNDELTYGIRFTANHILGYGYRKDITLHEMYEAVEACGNSAVGNIPDWIRRLSPITNDIFEFSEKEIRHIPGWRVKLIAQFLPERLADEFEYHLSEQDWSTCQDILEKLIQYYPLDSPIEEALLRSQTTYQSLTAMKNRSQDNSTLKQVFNEQVAFLGGFPPSPRESGSNSQYTEKDIDIEVSQYPPERLDDLCNELNSRQVTYKKNFLDKWMNYWALNDRGLDIVLAYESLLKSDADLPYVLQESLDSVFSLSFKLRGKKKSYELAIRSIHENRHWDRYRSSRSEDTILKYARIYKKDWRTFLKDSLLSDISKSWGLEWIYVPTCGLVKFFLAIDEIELAVNTTEVMLKCLEDEIAHLPLSPSYWKPQEISKEQVPAHILLWYYKWPDRVARLRTATQIAEILQKDQYFQLLFLDHLSHLKYEVDITDYLSILLVNENSVYSIEELVAAIKYPSILSNLLLKKLGYQIKETNRALYYSINENDDYTYSDAFIRAQNGLAPLYLSCLKRLGERLNYSLIPHCAYEWECIRDRQGISYFNYHSFWSDQYYSQDKVSASVSSHAETIILSAYLRTISYAYDNFNLSYAEVAFWANKVRPFGELYGSIQPSQAPQGWPIILDIGEEESLPDQNELSDYMRELGNQDEIILHASGPLIRIANGLCIDLEVRAFQSDQEINASPKEVYTALSHNSGFEIGVYPLTGSQYSENIGRWEIDRLLRGFHIPEFLIGMPPPSIIRTPLSIEYYYGDDLNATWKTWYENWYPAFYRGMGPSLGTYLTTPKEIWTLFTEKTDGHLYFLGRLSIIDKRNYNAKDEPDEVFYIIDI